jgi:hypothetical protein
MDGGRRMTTMGQLDQAIRTLIEREDAYGLRRELHARLEIRVSWDVEEFAEG